MKTMKIVFLLIIVLSSQDILGNDRTYLDGQKLYNAGDFLGAAKIWSALANEGDVSSKSAYGAMLLDGTGVKKDLALGVKFIEAAAIGGDYQAQFNAGVIYLYGIGASRDYGKAISYFLKADKQNDLEAAHNIGYMYQHGLGVAKDYRKSYEYYLKAAEKGLAIAQNDIAFFYTDESSHLPYNVDKALYWYRKAATQLLPRALENMGVAFYNGIGVQKDYVKACAYFEVAIELGSNDTSQIISISEAEMRSCRKSAKSELSRYIRRVKAGLLI